MVVQPSLKLSFISKLESVKEYLNLCDIFRLRFPDVLSIDILPSVNTDHFAVYLRLGQPDEINRGPSSWKFNNSLINNTTFFNEISDFIEKCKSYDLT